ncbi:MAG: hypothetical protein WBD81_24510 [Collimonas pratensis]|uniref:hypothetical protein n=1 Tax=Collimonas pratensis TaxID=279113 RepID=UPI003C70F43A
MDLWTFQRYEQPCLCVDAVEHDSAAAAISLRSGTQTYRLAFDDDQAAAQIAAELAALRDSATPLWVTLRDSEPGSSWHVLGTFLDTHSLISEGRNGAAQQLARQAERIHDCVANTVAAAFQELSAEQRQLAARHAQTLLQGLYRAAAIGPLFEPAGDPFDAAVQPNFFLALLAAELECFRRSSPLTLAATEMLLEAVAAEERPASPLRQSLADAAGLYNERDLASHLWLVASALAMSTGADAARFATSPIPAPALVSGLEFMRQTELLTRETLDLWGENPYLTAINKLNGAYAPLVAGPFIEQYHVTARFVEIIAPLLSMRLADPLRAMMFRYYSEEYGHEALESTTCQALGVAEATLRKTLPLPLHFAFVDVLTLLAGLDPISSFAAIMVIEGIFGEPPKMSLRLMAAARQNQAFGHISGEHDELNETLNHNSISRDMFECIGAVSPARQAITMRRILFLLELNHRAWGGIADFYGHQDQLRLQGEFGTRLAPGG